METKTTGNFALNAMYLSIETDQILFEVETSSTTHLKRMYYLATTGELVGKKESIVQLLFEHPHWAISNENPNLRDFVKLEPTPVTLEEANLVCPECAGMLERSHCSTCGYHE